MEKTSEIRLAVVDDAPFIREVVRQIVSGEESMRFIAEADDGDKAVEMAKNYDLDIIIMDIVMPKKSGIEATKEILEMKPDIKIIACSTVDQENMIMNALDAGCCDYMVKPFKVDTFRSAIKKAMSGEGLQEVRDV